jgi:hypothetical protein
MRVDTVVVLSPALPVQELDRVFDEMVGCPSGDDHHGARTAARARLWPLGASAVRGERGRGLRIIEKIMDRVRISTTAEGTIVRISRPLAGAEGRRKS